MKIITRVILVAGAIIAPAILLGIARGDHIAVALLLWLAAGLATTLIFSWPLHMRPTSTGDGAGLFLIAAFWPALWLVAGLDIEMEAIEK